MINPQSPHPASPVILSRLDPARRKAVPPQPFFASLLCGLSLLFAGSSPQAQAGIQPGEITFAEMNCAACHQASPGVADRLASRKAPVLGHEGLRISPVWLRDFLLHPQTEKPGTPMPDMLNGLVGAEKAAAAEALTHYLISLQSELPAAATRLDTVLVAEGKELFHQVGCVACHAPQELPAEAAAEPGAAAEFKTLAATSVALGNLDKKFTVDDLAAFLRDPLKVRPSGRMPAQRLTGREARSIAMYLLRNQPAPVPTGKIQGLNFESFVAAGDSLPDFNNLTPLSTGVVTNLSLMQLPHANGTGLRLRGILSVPASGQYTFWTGSRDGSRLFIDDQMIVDNNGIHRFEEKDGNMTLTAGDHRIVVTYFHHRGSPDLSVSWSGPGVVKQKVPNSALFLMDNGRFMHPVAEEPFVLDPVKAAKGRQLFASQNCSACHQIDQPGTAATPLAKLTPKQQGCLAATPSPGVPLFELTAQQRNDLTLLLANISALETSLAPADQVHRTMTALNCYACHSRDGLGSPSGLRRSYFKSLGTVDLGEEGAVPPHLNGVGAKLKSEWLQKVLYTGASVRPYMATRMPQFGQANVTVLLAAFHQADAGLNTGHELAVDPHLANGLRLVGNEGLSCISCHMFAGHPSLGVPALDLTTAPERLTPDWFRRYLLNPAQLRPGTRMPSFWPNGVSVNKAILEGDTEKQIAAIWSYLSSGQAAKNLPPGLIAPKMEIVAKTEAVVYRNFIEGAGPRAIGVGYPEKANLAWDANQMCVDLLWHGQFMDASRHWTGRGEGFQPPLGYSVVKLPQGQPLAVLTSADMPWPKTTERAAGYQFQGYAYDDQHRPQFHYQFHQVEAADCFVPVKFSPNADTGFRRRLLLKSKKPPANLWFRAALGDKIQDLGNQTYLVDGIVRLGFPPVLLKGRNTDAPASPQIMVRQSGGKSELLVPVIFESGKAELVEEISW